MDRVTQIWNELEVVYQSIIAVAGIIAFYLVFRLIILSRIERLAQSTANDLDDRVIHFIKQFLSVITLFVAIAVVLNINGIAISPLLAGAGIIGVSLGFAAKETIADILAGLFLIADRPIRVGDRVKLDPIGRHWGSWGDVVDIGIRRTRIRNTDGVNVNYPNSLLANSVITNFSYEPTPVRVRVRFQVDFDEDMDKTKKVVGEAIESCDKIVKDTVQVVTRSLWDDQQGHMLAGVLIEGRYRINDVRKRTAIRSEVLNAILRALKENNIAMASPRITINS